MNAQPESSSPTVLDVGVELLLVQVAPGYEHEIASSLTRAGIRSVYKILGKYDLLCVSTFEGEPQGIALLEPKCLPWVLDYEHLVTFLFRSEHASELLSRLSCGQLASTNWFSLTLLKLNAVWFEPATSDSPIQKQFALGFKRLETQLSKTGITDYLVLGGLGWFDNIVLMWSDDPARIAEVSLDVGGSSEGGQALFLKSLTIFALSYEFIFTDTEGRRRRSWGLLGGDKRITPELSVSCRTEHTSELLEVIKDRFEAPHGGVVFGSEDLVGESGLVLGEYFERLLDFRQTYGRERGLVWATTTRLKFCPEQEAVGQVPGAKCPEPLAAQRKALIEKPDLITPVRFDEETPEVARKDTADLHKRFSQMYLTAMQSPVTCEAYVDMLPALRELGRTRGDRQILDEPFRDVLLYLNLGYQQRSLGTLNSPWGFGNPVPLFYRGGVHRALWAVEGLIDSLLLQAGEKWSGFAVFGITPDYLRSHLGIVTVPLRAVLDPGEWWGVFHEVGHECFYQRLQDPERQTLLDDVIGPKEILTRQGDQIARQHLVSQVWEAVSDIFDYEFGFVKDWELYKKTVIDYLVGFFLAGKLKEVVHQGYGLQHTPLGQQLLGYLSRFLAVYIHRSVKLEMDDLESYYGPFRLEVIDLMERRMLQLLNSPELGLAEEDTRRFIAELGRLLASRSLKRHFLDLGYKRLVLMEPGRKFLASVLPAPLSPELIRRSFEAAKQVAAGRVVTDDVPLPQVLVCELKRTARPAYRSKIATILTLWNMYAKRLPAVVDFALSN